MNNITNKITSCDQIHIYFTFVKQGQNQIPSTNINITLYSLFTLVILLLCFYKPHQNIFYTEKNTCSFFKKKKICFQLRCQCKNTCLTLPLRIPQEWPQNIYQGDIRLERHIQFKLKISIITAGPNRPGLVSNRIQILFLTQENKSTSHEAKACVEEKI